MPSRPYSLNVPSLKIILSQECWPFYTSWVVTGCAFCQETAGSNGRPGITHTSILVLDLMKSVYVKKIIQLDEKPSDYHIRYPLERGTELPNQRAQSTEGLTARLLLEQLHWLPFCFHAQYEVLVLIHKALYTTWGHHICETTLFHTSWLVSPYKGSLIGTTTHGDGKRTAVARSRDTSIVALTLWNYLPLSL